MESEFSQNSQMSQNTNELAQPQEKPNLKRKKSQVWDFFSVSPIQTSKAICNICSASISREGTKPGNYSVSNLKSHLQSKHITEFNSLIQPRNSMESTDVQSMELQINYFSQSSIRAQQITKAIGVMIALDMRPFSIVENKGFRDLISLLEPRYKIPNRKFFSLEIIPKLYENVKNFIVSSYDFGNIRSSFTTDFWSSINGDSYMSLTVHFIDAKFQRVNLALETLPYSKNHTAIEISNSLKEVLFNWGLNTKDSLYFVHDNASNISLAIELLGHTSIYCANHTLQLVVKDALNSSITGLIFLHKALRICRKGLKVPVNMVSLKRGRFIFLRSYRFTISLT